MFSVLSIYEIEFMNKTKHKQPLQLHKENLQTKLKHEC